MLQKFAITDIKQLDKAVKDTQSIVIYGTGFPGRLAVDYLIKSGNRNKIAAIVHTRGKEDYLQAYRQIPIYVASAFFAQPEHKNEFVLVAVRNPKHWDEIFEALENYGVQSCSCLNLPLSTLADLAAGGTHRSDIRSYIFTEDQLCDLVDKASGVVIYGAGGRSDRLIKFLEQAGRGSKIQKASDKYNAAASPAEPAAEDALVLVSPDSLSLDDPNILSEEIKNLDFKSCYFCTWELMEKLFTLLKDKSQGEGVQEPQFVVAGFPKCGTTSLYYALQEVKDIYLPDCKESLFFTEGKSAGASKEKWLGRFYNRVPKGNVSGCVEPTFAPFAKEIRETLGPDLRVCFLMRNPVGATYSWFKMINRRGDNPSLFRYDRYGIYCDEMFDDFITDLLEQKEIPFEYANFLEEFLQYYPMEQIQVVMFEELIRESSEKVNEILRFVGSKAVYDPQLGLPKENTGDFVWADQEGIALATRRGSIGDEKRKWLNWHILDDPEAALVRANELENEQFRLNRQLQIAEKVYNPQMTPEQRKRLEDFYRPSVRKLEKMLGKDLSKLWFE